MPTKDILTAFEEIAQLAEGPYWQTKRRWAIARIANQMIWQIKEKEKDSPEGKVSR